MISQRHASKDHTSEEHHANGSAATATTGTAATSSATHPHSHLGQQTNASDVAVDPSYTGTTGAPHAATTTTTTTTAHNAGEPVSPLSMDSARGRRGGADEFEEARDHFDESEKLSPPVAPPRFRTRARALGAAFSGRVGVRRGRRSSGKRSRC